MSHANGRVSRNAVSRVAGRSEAIGDKFPLCASALSSRTGSPITGAVDAVGAPHVGERTEKELITAFCDKIAELSPQLVSMSPQEPRP